MSLDWINYKMENDAILLEGNIADNTDKSPTSSNFSPKALDTLDEPISETLARDLKGIVSKVKCILLPISSVETNKCILKDWDLWGPLVLCTFVALVLHHGDDNLDGKVGPHFAELFVLMWFGSLMVSLNYKLLSLSNPKRKTGGGVKHPVCPSIFQLLCVFGYCLASPCFGILMIKLTVHVIIPAPLVVFYTKLCIGIAFGFLLPTLSAVRILRNYQDKEKQALAIYPIALFYFCLSWIIISSH